MRFATCSLVALAALAPQLGCQHVPPRPLSPEEAGRVFLSRSLDEAELRSFLEAALGEPLPEWPLRRWSLDTLTLAALYFQPEPRRRSGAGAARRAPRSASAGARPNPTLSVAPEFSTNPEAGVSPWLAAIHLDWPIETAGKRRTASSAQARRRTRRASPCRTRRGASAGSSSPW